MGTSSSYRGSSSKVARDLRQGLEEWTQSADPGGSHNKLPEQVVARTLLIPVFKRQVSGTSDGPSGGGGARGSGQAATSKKQSAPRRDARAYASTASRAAGLAQAFREGDREALEKAGLDFDRLSQSPSRSEMVRSILDVVCEGQTSSDIPTEEQRDIAGRLLDWMLDEEINPSLPEPVATAEYAIGLIIAEIFLSEAGEVTSTDTLSRDEFINEVYEASHHLAAKANLDPKKVSQVDIDKSVQKGLRFLRRMHAKGDE